MARKKKQVEVELYDENKQEVAYDFGEWKVPTSWDEVTLQMFADYLTMSAEKEKLYKEDVEKAKAEVRKDKKGMEKLEKVEKSEIAMPNENDDKYSMTDRDLLGIFTGKTKEEIEMLPVEFYDTIMAKLSFLVDPYNQDKPKRDIMYKGLHLCVNDMEKLKVKEWEDCETILRTNPYDYPSLLAILCREVTGEKTDHVTGFRWLVNEPYDSEFANEKFDGRRELFANMPMSVAMPIVSFFLYKGIVSTGVLENSIQTIKAQLEEGVESIFDSVRNGGLPRWRTLPLMMRLKKLKKSLKNI